MKKKALVALNNLALMLPKETTGATIRKYRGVARNEDGSIKEGRVMLSEQPVRVNHKRRMKRLLKSGGKEAVRQYTEQVLLRHQNDPSQP